jgi:hypothetical protein
MDKRFHSIGLMITKHEKYKDYSFQFKTIKSLINELFNINYEPKILIGMFKY